MSSPFADKQPANNNPFADKGKEQQAPTGSNVPCIDWLGTEYPRFICPHCNNPAIRGVKRWAAYFIVCSDQSWANTVYRIGRELSDHIAKLLTLGLLTDCAVVVRSGNTISTGAVNTAPVTAFAVSDAFLAAHLDSFPLMPENLPLTFRVTQDWPGLAFILYHPNTPLSAIDSEMKTAGYSNEALEAKRQLVMEALEKSS